MSQKDEIIRLASEYGLDTTSGGSQLESLQRIAENLGMNDYNGLSNSDTDELERRLAEYVKSQDNQNRSKSNVLQRKNEKNNFDLSEIAKKKLRIKIIIGLLIGFGIIFIFLVLFTAISSLDDDGSSSGDDMAYSGQECGFTISATSLSKSEFKSKIEEYAKSHGQWQVFANHANEIYDLAKAKNVNPELVITVAYKEGNGYETAGSNNYWGLDCPNGASSCGSYGSFMQGAEILLNSASKYDTLADWFNKGSYSYIGYFWYNPGSWGAGGCIYAPYIYPDGLPDRVQRACSGSSCSILDNDWALRNQWVNTGINPRPGCTPTTDDDQAAYTRYLVNNKMGEARRNIFGLDFDEGPCVGGSGVDMSLADYTLNGGNLGFLERKLTDSEKKKLSDLINSSIEYAGHGSGAAVAAAGQSLVYGLEKFTNSKLHYLYGGGHSGGYDSTFVGVSDNWGSGDWLDCSAFVSWATRTGCNDSFGTLVSGNWLSLPGVKTISLKDAKPGDVLTSESHIQLVVKNNGDGSVIVAEEKGTAYGLLFTKVSSTSLTVLDMSGYYSNNCKDIRPGKKSTKDDVSSNLKQKINNYLNKDATKGSWAVYVKNLKTKNMVNINSGNKMIAASEIKLYIMAATYDQISKGNISEGSVQSYLSSMITVSDNGSANSLINLVGMDTINKYISDNGYSSTKLNRKMLDYNGTENYVSAKDIGVFLEKIYRGQVINSDYSNKMLNLLKGQQVRHKIPSGVPSDVTVASKTGELDTVENDAAIVYAGGDYIIVVLSNNLSDTGAAQNNIKEISKIVYDYYS